MITLNMQFLRVGVSRGKDFFKTIYTITIHVYDHFYPLCSKLLMNTNCKRTPE